MNSFSTNTGEVRRFGLIAVVLFGSLAALAAWRQQPLLGAFFCLPASVGALILILPAPMAPVHRGWVRLGQWIGRGTTLVMLTLVYFLVISPYGMIMRGLGKRPLPQKPDRRLSSYWVPRAEPAQPKDRFYKRY